MTSSSASAPPGRPLHSSHAAQPSQSAHIQVELLGKTYRIRQGWLASKKTLHAVSNLSFSVERGGTFGLVGESGSGKSTLARMLLGAEKASAGSIRIGTHTPAEGTSAQRKAFHRSVQPVLQDPYSSLSPLQRIAQIIEEPIRIHGLHDKHGREQRVLELLAMVGLPAELARRYPHELSGGQRQRVAIARALGAEPEVLVLDEPVSALDVSVQAQILNLLKDLQESSKLTYVMISHDLAIVAHMSSQIGVLYLGEFMEIGGSADIIAGARHPYTQALIASSHNDETQPIARGEIPSPVDLPQGCLFQSRCPHATAQCRQHKPALRQVAAAHWLACHYDVAPLALYRSID